MSSLFDPTRNFSFYAIPVAWVLSIAPHFYSQSLYNSKSSKKFDLREPRSFTKMVAEDQSIDQATKGRILRAESAQQNGFENIGLFAAAVVAGNAAGLDNWWLNTLSAGYIASRAVYNFIYINNTTEGIAQTRTAVFLGGLGMIMSLFVMAGNTLRNTALSK